MKLYTINPNYKGAADPAANTWVRFKVNDYIEEVTSTDDIDHLIAQVEILLGNEPEPTPLNRVLVDKWEPWDPYAEFEDEQNAEELSGLPARVSGLELTVSNLELTVSVHETSIDNINSLLLVFGDRLDALEENLGKLEKRVEDLENA